MMIVTPIRGTVVETKCVDGVVATTEHGVTWLHEPRSFMVHIRHNDDVWVGFDFGRQGRAADATRTPLDDWLDKWLSASAYTAAQARRSRPW